MRLRGCDEPDAGRDAHRKEMKKIKDEQRKERASADKQAAEKKAPGFWIKKANVPAWGLQGRRSDRLSEI